MCVLVFNSVADQCEKVKMPSINLLNFESNIDEVKMPSTSFLILAGIIDEVKIPMY